MYERAIIMVGFTESDHQLLTNHGWLTLEDFQAKQEAGVEVLFAGINETNETIVYEKHTELIVNTARKEIIEFGSSSERQRFNAEHTDAYGKIRCRHGTRKEPGVGTTSISLSLRVTADHTMWVQRGYLWGMNNCIKVPDKTWHTVKAKDLLPENAKWTEHRPAVRMLSTPINGLEAVSGAFPGWLDLGITTRDQELAFMSILGFFIGDGYLSLKKLDPSGRFRHNSRDAVCFTLGKSRDKKFVFDAFETLGLTDGPGGNYYCSKNGSLSTGETVLDTRLRDTRYTTFYRAEFDRRCRDLADAFIKVTPNPGTPDPEGGISSAKWVPEWVYHLPKEHGIAFFRGLEMADGCPGHQTIQIYTSSARFRDELCRLALHAGMSASFRLHKKSGHAYKGITKQHDSWPEISQTPRSRAVLD